MQIFDVWKLINIRKLNLNEVEINKNFIIATNLNKQIFFKAVSRNLWINTISIVHSSFKHYLLNHKIYSVVVVRINKMFHSLIECFHT